MHSNRLPIEHAYNSDKTPSEAVVAALVNVFNRDPLKMKPLYEFIDPDALDALFRSRPSDDSEHSDMRIEFRYDSFHITMTDDYVRVLDSEEARTN